MKVLTVQNVIANNARIFMLKIRYFPNLLPKSLRETLSNNAPNYSFTHENNMACLETRMLVLISARQYFKKSSFSVKHTK